jgi:hypothetical protein
MQLSRDFQIVMDETIAEAVFYFPEDQARGKTKADALSKKMVRHLERELDKLLRDEKDELKLLRQLRTEQEQRLTKIMIAQSTFDTSLKALTDAVAQLTTPGTPSTPDNVVQAYIAGVDTNTAHLQASATPPAPPAPAAP